MHSKTPSQQLREARQRKTNAAKKNGQEEFICLCSQVENMQEVKVQEPLYISKIVETTCTTGHGYFFDCDELDQLLGQRASTSCLCVQRLARRIFNVMRLMLFKANFVLIMVTY